ncbi:Nuclear pore complex protein GP210 [Camellia lanceoleosa]|uniref:Nuclear pore complex protein GP210 n=1 Tax=Camellia lanceoleosa TaxID=1840588 RepID=A0ACC0FE43_9ERIC|nr:Nuclear pore complex protein GP210 [Camellia lanceoleosa]
MISVGSHLYPKNPVLHLGNQLNFSVEGLNDQVFGRWLSTNESVIYVDMIFGNAETIREAMIITTSLKLLGMMCKSYMTVEWTYLLSDMQRYRRISLEIHIASSFLTLQSI